MKRQAKEKTYISNNRRFLSCSSFLFAHHIWNLNNPNDKIERHQCNFVVHHKDGNTLNDDISNLQKMTRKEHNLIHKPHSIGHTEETKKKMSLSHKMMSDETRKKMSLARIGKTLSEESKKKVGLASKGNKYALGYRHTEEARKKISEALKERHRRRKLC